MSNSYTAYFSPGIRIYDGDVNNTTASNVVPREFRSLSEHPMLSHREDRVVMAIADTRSIEPMNIGAASDNERSLVVLKVIGRVKVTVVGKDSDDAADLTGISEVFGTAYLPGYLVLMPYNVTSITLEAIAASTVDVLTGILVLSTDSRL